MKGIVKLPYYGLDIKNSFLGVILELCMYFQIYKGSGIWMWEEEDYFKIRLPNDHFFLVMNKMDKINFCVVSTGTCGMQMTSACPIMQETSDLMAHTRLHSCLCWTSFLNVMTPACHLLYMAVKRDDSSPCMNTFFILAINNHDNDNIL